MIVAVFVSLVLLLALGVPVAFGIGLSGAAGLLVNGNIPLEVIAQRAFAALDSWALMAVPLFILAGELMNACGISSRAIAIVGAPLVMSERVFESLSAAEQEAVRLAAKRAVAAERESYRRAEESALEALVAAGVTITHPDRSQLEGLSRRMWEASSDRVSLELVERIAATSADDEPQ